MEETIIYELKSLYRDTFKIRSFTFGEGEESICIIGSLRGNEVQQTYICSLLIEKLKEYEKEGKLIKNHKVTVIPSANCFSQNIGKRFWASDDTDINRMFPGYSQGETTQRIAEGLFDKIKDYHYGVQLTSFYIPGHFSTHIRMMKTGMEDIEEAKHFGLPYIVVRNPRPYDTTTLNYNWQIWNCKAYSLYTKACDEIDEKSAQQACECILRFLYEKGIVNRPVFGGYRSEIILENQMVSIKSHKAGFLKTNVEVNDIVKKGEIIAHIYDPYEHKIIEEIKASHNGTIFFLHAHSLVYAHTAIAKIKLHQH